MSTTQSELVRLEDSVQRLIQTQEALKEVIDAEASSNEVGGNADEEIVKAYEENVEVM
jgi:hypothetical protein